MNENENEMENENNNEVIIENSMDIKDHQMDNKGNDMNELKLSVFQNDSNNNKNINKKPLIEKKDNLKKSENDNNSNQYSISGNITNEQNSEVILKKEINLKSSHFPYCIVWTPIPLITYLFPSIGHTGIGTSTGIIHDFAGSFFVGVDDFAFGKPTKYIQLKLTEQEKYNWDRAIEKGDNKYNMEEHNIFINNCHSHVAYVLNQLNYRGKNNYNMVNIWWMLIAKGKYVSFCGFFKTYIGFLIIILIVLIIVLIKK